MSFAQSLSCRECGRVYPLDPMHVCEFCFGPLEVFYDYDSLRRTLTRERIERGPIEPPELPEVDIGHLSTAVDAINQKAILDGAAMGLDGGLEFESQCFGECFALEDSRIGIENFMKNGPRSKAEFKNR